MTSSGSAKDTGSRVFCRSSTGLRACWAAWNGPVGAPTQSRGTDYGIAEEAPRNCRLPPSQLICPRPGALETRSLRALPCHVSLQPSPAEWLDYLDAVSRRARVG